MSNNYLVERLDNITSTDLTNLRLFYSCIIGTNATSFYQYLNDLSNLSINIQKTHTLDETTEFLLLTKDQIEDARNKLEAIGLLKSYNWDNDGILFSLKRPLNANEISKNSFISSFIIEKLGEEKYQSLLKNQGIFTFDKENKRDISKKFYEVFDLSKINIKATKFFNNFEVMNNKNAIKTMASEDFIKFITGNESSPSQLLMIKKLRKIKFNDNCINLFINFSINVNKIIIVNYIEKIAQDYAKRDLFLADEVDLELNATYLSKKMNNNISYQSEYEDIEKTSEKILNLCGETNWDD
ncbi:hypothetical protein [Metamycoplasma buccale]|uniref:hypothetical protein n=1 Tax=Metamycoplasma buccale TaxID=55602 RepID=UPI00398F2313